MLRPFLLCLLCVSPVAGAGIYKSVDENGKVIYTDNPNGKKADPVKLPPLNTQPPPTATAAPIPEQNMAPERAPKEYDIRISSPADQTQIPPGQRNLTVAANLAPGLHSTHKVQVYINGSPHGSPSESTSVTIDNIYRGTHQIVVEVLDRWGNTISRSEPVTVYVHRVSVAN